MMYDKLRINRQGNSLHVATILYDNHEDELESVLYFSTVARLQEDTLEFERQAINQIEDSIDLFLLKGCFDPKTYFEELQIMSINDPEIYWYNSIAQQLQIKHDVRWEENQFVFVNRHLEKALKKVLLP